MKGRLVVVLVAGICLGWGVCRGQPVTWKYRAERTHGGEGVVMITATLAPGWYLYSQFLEEGGPMPTCISFMADDGYELLGRPAEHGKAERYRDVLYDLDIVKFTGTVTFVQRIRLEKEDVRIKGEVRYMVCNDFQCVPGREGIWVQLAISN
jgi:hypothetical protein